MARNNIVRGLIKTKDWFFQVTGSPAKRGSRFLTGDRPTEIIFRAFLESFTNKAELTDRAYEDIETKTLSEKQGLVTLATDAQAKARIDKSDSIARVVQPSQLPEITAGAGITITIDPTETKRTKYIIEGGNVCSCVTGIGQDIATEVPNDADIVVFYDGTSFLGNALLNANEKITYWFNSYRINNPDFKGNLIEIQLGSTNSSVSYNIRDASHLGTPGIGERFLLFPKEFMDNNIDIALKVTSADGTSLTNVSLTAPTKSKYLFILFEDEAAGVYHTDFPYTIPPENAEEVFTPLYVNDYNTFIQDTYNRFSFFKMIMYPAIGAVGEWNKATTANFHAMLTKALTTGIPELTPGLTATQASVGWDSDAMDFMTISNPFSPYTGLNAYNFISTQYAFSGDGAMTSISNDAFMTQVNNALQDAESIYKTVTITPWIEYNNDPDTKVYGTPYQLKVLK